MSGYVVQYSHWDHTKRVWPLNEDSYSALLILLKAHNSWEKSIAGHSNSITLQYNLACWNDSETHQLRWCPPHSSSSKHRRIFKDVIDAVFMFKSIHITWKICRTYSAWPQHSFPIWKWRFIAQSACLYLDVYLVSHFKAVPQRLFNLPTP